MDSRDRQDVARQRRAGGAVTKGIEPQIEQLHRLSRWKRFVEVLPFLAMYSTGAGVVSFSSEMVFLKCSGVILMGLALNSLGILIHEGLHGLLDKNPRINHVFSFLCGLPILISTTAYQVTHCDHHFEFGRKLDYGTYKQHLDKKSLVWLAYFVQLLFGSVLYVMFIPILAFRSASRVDRVSIVVEYLLIASLAGMLIAFASLETILWYWVFPSILLMLLSNIRGLASHALGDLDDIYLSSRTVESSSLVSRLFLHENYHLAHHLFPQVPSYHLKQIHRLTWHRLPRALYSKSYREFLASFFKAAWKRELTPRGLIHPRDRAPADQL